MSESSPPTLPASSPPALLPSAEECPCGHERKGYTITKGVIRLELKKGNMLLMPKKAWVLDPKVLNHHRAKIKQVEVFDKDSGSTYTVDADQFFEKSFFVDVGFGDTHLALGLDDWQITKNPTLSKKKRVAAVQTGFSF